jgi:hypothetical protein
MTTADNGPKTEAWAADEAAPAAAGTAPGEAGTTSGEHLVLHDAVVDFRSRWEVVQQGFVDDPPSAVKDADSLVGHVLEELSATFEDQRRHLEGQWSDGEPDTEELRLTLRRYRDFFDFLLTI